MTAQTPVPKGNGRGTSGENVGTPGRAPVGWSHDQHQLQRHVATRGPGPARAGSPDGELATYRDLPAPLPADAAPQVRGPRAGAARPAVGAAEHAEPARAGPPHGAVEHFWFRRVLQGRHDEERMFRSRGGPRPRLQRRDRHARPHCGASTRRSRPSTSRREACTPDDVWLDRLDEASLGGRSPSSAGGTRRPTRPTVRDVLVHMVEEYARHCGHADLLRECIDGRTGQ
jgi:hypothetical protein